MTITTRRIAVLVLAALIVAGVGALAEGFLVPFLRLDGEGTLGARLYRAPERLPSKIRHFLPVCVRYARREVVGLDVPRRSAIEGATPKGRSAGTGSVSEIRAGPESIPRA
jgi:hypothetical protein